MKLKKIRYPLYIQTLGMLFAYLSVLILGLFICFNAQFGFGWEALLKSPAGDHAEAIAETISLHLSTADSSKWNEILETFGKKYGVALYVFDIFGNQLAGAKVNLPPTINSHIKIDPQQRAFSEMFPPPPPMLPHQLLPIGGQFIAPLPPPPFECGEVRISNNMRDFPERHYQLPILHTLYVKNLEIMSPNLSLSKNLIKSNFMIFPPPLPPPPLPYKHEHDKFISQSERSLWICMPIGLLIPSFPFPIPAFLIASSVNIWQNTLLFDFRFMSLILFGFLIFSVIFWWPFVFNITRKLSALTITAENIAKGNFTTPVDAGFNDEIGRLSTAIKSMSDRLNSFVKGQKRLFGDISHELITPLARLDMALELFDSSSAEERNALIADVKDEVQEMRLMVNELLAFGKAGLQNKQLKLQAVNLLSVIEKAVRQLPDNKMIDINVSPGSVVLADSMLLLCAISNVLRNSIRYAGDAGPISVETIDTEQTISIIIADCGPGVPEEILPFLGEPFFRPEFSRNRDSGGIGLGLAIVRSCVECCHGVVALSNRTGGGFQTEICLQKSY